MTTLIRWSPPFRAPELIETRMRRLFEDVGLLGTGWPAADVYETDEELVIELEVAGYDESELHVELVDRILTVKGVRKEEKELEDKSYHVRERLEHTFERRFELPLNVDETQLHATWGKGILELHAPKIGLKEPRTVEITAR